MKNKNSLKHFISLHRRTVIIVATILGVLAITTCYVIWSKNTWGAYEQHYTEWKSDFNNRVGTVLALPADTTEEREAKTTQFKEVGKFIESEATLCVPNTLIAWQKPLFSLEEKEKQCKAIKDAATLFKDKLEAILAYLDNEQKLAKILSDAPRTDKPLIEKDWSGHITGWQSTLDSVKNLSASSSFDPVKQRSIEVIAGVVAAWNEVMAASQAKDKPRYLKAQQALAGTFNGFSQLTPLATEQMQPMAADLEAAYRGISP